MCSCLRPIGGDDGKVIAAVSAYTGRWLHDNKGNTPLLRSWGPFGPRVPTYIDLCTRPSSTQQSYLSAAVSAHWGRRLREQSGFLRHGREEKAVTKGLGTDTDPDCPCSLLIRVIPPGCPTGRLWGIFTGQCSMEPWHVNCAIRCSGTTVEPCRLHRVRGCQVWLPRAVHAQWAEVRTLHFFPGRGCTHSAHHSEPE